MNTIWVLLMVFSTSHIYGGVAVVQQEFMSKEACEAARAVLGKADNDATRVVGAQGCFKK